MSRFYGSLEGRARTLATRCGTTASGVRAHVRGWSLGIVAGVGDDYFEGAAPGPGRDCGWVGVTGGSNDPAQTILLYVREKEAGRIEVEISPELASALSIPTLDRIRRVGVL